MGRTSGDPGGVGAEGVRGGSSVRDRHPRDIRTGLCALAAVMPVVHPECMEPRGEHAPDPTLLRLLQAGERVELGLATTSGDLRVTDRRILVTAHGAVRLDIPYEGLRRIQFDIENDRPATLVIVPHRPGDEPQVLAIPRESLHAAAELIAFVGERLP
jgi:hypothetical protein